MKPVLVCLHGWGGSKESFTELREALGEDNVDILPPDLPGFGAEPEPEHAWTVDDYADWVEVFVRKHVDPLRPILLLGHSHGGRISLKLATRGTIPIKHLFLCAGAGIRRTRHFKRLIGLTLAKCGKALLSIPGLNLLQPLGKKFLYKLVRVHDYEKASPVMRDTLIKVTREDLRPLLPEVKIPTDLFWGKDDGMTPFADAILMERGIKGSTLHSYEGVRHRVHRDKAPEIAAVIRTHLQ